ncbi:MAG: dipeptide ABC transporter ATP-binding protein [Betaproteobacteria bacterium]|nr:dipeptide ABC transporter ATP-binding protein [Betaproteobacteria bacterium]
MSVNNLTTWVTSGGGQVPVVRDVSFQIRRGETFALVGESGSGKSMTALSIMRLLPDGVSVGSGHVVVGGTNITALPERDMRDIRGRVVSMIFQEPATSLNPVMTVGHQVREVLWKHMRVRGKEADDRVSSLFESVGIPDPRRRLKEYPFQLSGGLKQRVMIAMALACEPALLVADEPTTALDVTIQAQVLDVLRETQARTGMSMLLITHDLAVVSQIASRVGVMYAGRLVELAQASDLRSTVAHPYTRRLFEALPTPSARGKRLANIAGSAPVLADASVGCAFAPRCGFVRERCRTVTPAQTTVAVDHVVRCHRSLELRASGWREEAPRPLHATGVTPREHAESGARLLSIEGLAVHFPIRRGVLQRVVAHARAVDGVDLALGRGRTVALVGESGCGKTTVAKGIMRLIEPDDGRISFDGRDVRKVPERHLGWYRRSVQMVFQDPFASLNPRMQVAQILEEGVRALYRADELRSRLGNVDRLLADVGLDPDARWRYPHEFSGGQRQRIAIARALAVDPELIVCDEPTSALDVSVQAQILNLLRDLQAERALSYLFITHNIAVVQYLADEVLVMYLGRIVERGTTSEVLDTPAHPYTKALLASVPRIEGRPPVVQRVKGDLPSLVHPPTGCHFHPRCPLARSRCRVEYPAPVSLSKTHVVHCVAVDSTMQARDS